MNSLSLKFDKKAEANIDKLKKRYGVMTKAEIIRKGLNLLKIAAKIEDQGGQLIARSKEGKETRIIIT